MSPRPTFTRLLAGLSLTAATSFASAQTCAGVEVNNVQPRQGHLMLTAFLDADSFNKSPVTAIRTLATETTMRLQVCGLSGDSVALTLFQDLDSDGKLGRNVLGIPSEPWGASGTPAMTGPKWESAKVALNGSTIVVRLSQ